MKFVDTHCHIHESEYPGDREAAYQRALDADVTRLICVGTTLRSSKEALAFAATHEGTYATIGVHPHEATDGVDDLRQLTSDKLVAIGEIGLDYFYTHSPKEAQVRALEQQLQLATDRNLPVIFHVRDAFQDFWPIFDNFQGLRGVLHSFTDSAEQLEAGLRRGLFIGVNGISTFTKDEAQRELLSHIPLDRLLLETDAPFLTPHPLRGTVNEPALVRVIAQFQADERGVTLEAVAETTTHNATHLFGL